MKWRSQGAWTLGRSFWGLLGVISLVVVAVAVLRDDLIYLYRVKVQQWDELAAAQPAKPRSVGPARKGSGVHAPGPVRSLYESEVPGGRTLPARSPG